MRPADTWKDYELLDATDGNRLERWGVFHTTCGSGRTSSVSPQRSSRLPSVASSSS